MSQYCDRSSPFGVRECSLPGLLSSPAGPPARSAFGRVMQNVAWLLAGKGTGALLSIAYLGLATRTLGPAGFGEFALVLGTGQAIVAFVSFQTWQVVVRYGMGHLKDGRSDRLARLVAFCTALDLAGALVGCLIAVAAVLLLAGPLGWSDELTRDALLFSLVMLVSIRSTAVGVLRLHDRFGLGAAADAVTPVTRLAGALAAVAAGATVQTFLLAWAAAELATAFAYWTTAKKIAAPLLGVPRIADVRGALAENQGLRHFALVSNAGSTLGAVGKQFAVLIVGLSVGPVAAGAYRLAHQLSQALARVSDLFARAVFAETARVHADGESDTMRRLFRHSTRLSLAAGIIIIVTLTFVGKPLLGLIAGPEYLPVYPLLVLLGTAAALDVAGVGFEPTLMATGRAGGALRLRLVVTAALLILLAILLPMQGLMGAGMAVLAASALGLALFGAAAWRAIRT